MTSSFFFDYDYDGRQAKTKTTMRLVLLLLVAISCAHAFVHTILANKPTDKLSVRLFAENRRRFLENLALGVTITTLSAATAHKAAAASDGGPTIWLTGKAPRAPGQKPQDKSDTRGTRKDPSFLRSISDCKSQCEQSSGTLARTKEECLQDCQDICCTTYEQCTFAIVPR
jgi:hypothetical protein